jgi:1,4-dihydroxy-2-naphthoate octaprenyltransferase
MRIWLLAARPRTLPAAVAPVLVGTAYAVGLTDHLRWGTFIAAMLGAIFIQIGTNLSNDYSDARRGADTEERLGPVRVTAGGLVPPKSVLRATYIAFGCAVLCGVYLIAMAGWIVLAIGSASIIAGVLYTGGPRPYGYEGLGEVFVFTFFGLVAVSGSAYVQLEEFTWEALALAVPVGFLATAILVVNNVRDISTDARAGKRTLAVRMGRERSRNLFALLIYGAFLALIGLAIFITPYVLIAVVAVVGAAPLVRKVRNHSDGPTLNEALAHSGMLQLVFCVLLSAGLILA